jgi:hypothetical protein
LVLNSAAKQPLLGPINRPFINGNNFGSNSTLKQLNNPPNLSSSQQTMNALIEIPLPINRQYN